MVPVISDVDDGYRFQHGALDYDGSFPTNYLRPMAMETQGIHNLHAHLDLHTQTGFRLK